MYWKDIMIFIDFFNKGIMEDLRQMINYFLNINTYKNILHFSAKTAKKSLLGSKNQLFISMFVIVLATMTRQILYIFLSIILFFIMYGIHKWKTGEPLKFYKDRYFSDKITEKFK